MAIGVGLAEEPAGVSAFRAHPPFLAYVPEVDLPIDDDRYPYLRLVDPYDDTVFSSYQCRVVEPEFARLVEDHRDPKYAEALGLLRRCADDLGSSLWFIGD